MLKRLEGCRGLFFRARALSRLLAKSRCLLPRLLFLRLLGVHPALQGVVLRLQTLS